MNRAHRRKRASSQSLRGTGKSRTDPATDPDRQTNLTNRFLPLFQLKLYSGVYNAAMAALNGVGGVRDSCRFDETIFPLHNSLLTHKTTPGVNGAKTGREET